MAKCMVCGEKMGFFDGDPYRRCDVCQKADLWAEGHHMFKAKEVSDHARQKIELKVSTEAILLTTETAPNLNITKRIEIVTAECAFGMNIFKDLFAGVRNVVGGRSEAVQKTMRDSRKTVLYELKKEAYEVGANAVVGVDLDYVELSNAGSMVMLVASGTAVVIEEGQN